MKIILADNFDRKCPGASDDALIAERVSEHFADAIVLSLNESATPASDDYVFKAVPDNYKLRKYTP